PAWAGAVETGCEQRGDMVAPDSARVNFHAGFDVVGEREAAMDDVAEAADFIGRQERGRAAAPVELDQLAARIEQRAHLGHFLLQISEVSLALAVVEGDDGRAAAKPAKGFAEWDMEINGEVALRSVVLQDALRQFLPGEPVRELRGGRVGGVTRPGHVVLLHEVQINFERAHGFAGLPGLNSLTVFTRLSMASTLALGRPPWPKFNISPRRPRI